MLISKVRDSWRVLVRGSGGEKAYAAHPLHENKDENDGGDDDVVEKVWMLRQCGRECASKFNRTRVTEDADVLACVDTAGLGRFLCFCRGCITVEHLEIPWIGDGGGDFDVEDPGSSSR